MTTEEWREKVAADRPPLTQAQIAALRPVFAPASQHMRTAPAPAEAEPRESPSTEHERSCNGQH